MLRRMRIFGSEARVSVMVSLLGLPGLLGGCAYGEMREVVRSQFAAETNCPSVSVEPRKVYDQDYKEGQYLVTGCDVVRTYSCSADTGLVSYDDKSCTFINGEMVKPKEPPKPVTGPAEGEDMDSPPPAASIDDEPKPTVTAAPAKTQSRFSGGGAKASGSAGAKFGK